jgi:succinate-semialdehyde dehydrogenase/glutarate-semialdehyde dehydrogenase
MELNNKSLFKQECFIGGEWVNSINGETIEVENPATQETIGIVPKCDAQLFLE